MKKQYTAVYKNVYCSILTAYFLCYFIDHSDQNTEKIEPVHTKPILRADSKNNNKNQ